MNSNKCASCTCKVGPLTEERIEEILERYNYSESALRDIKRLVRQGLNYICTKNRFYYRGRALRKAGMKLMRERDMHREHCWGYEMIPPDTIYDCEEY